MRRRRSVAPRSRRRTSPARAAGLPRPSGRRAAPRRPGGRWALWSSFLLCLPHAFLCCDQRLQAQPRDARDLLQRFLELGGAIALEALGEAGDDRCPVETLDRDDERKSEPGVIGAIELLQPRELLGRALGEAGAGLLGVRIGRQLAADRRLAGQLRMRADERELRVFGCGAAG